MVWCRRSYRWSRLYLFQLRWGWQPWCFRAKFLIGIKPIIKFHCHKPLTTFIHISWNMYKISILGIIRGVVGVMVHARSEIRVFKSGHFRVGQPDVLWFCPLHLDRDVIGIVQRYTRVVLEKPSAPLISYRYIDGQLSPRSHWKCYLLIYFHPHHQ